MTAMCDNCFVFYFRTDALERNIYSNKAYMCLFICNSIPNLLIVFCRVKFPLPLGWENVKKGQARPGKPTDFGILSMPSGLISIYSPSAAPSSGIQLVSHAWDSLILYAGYLCIYFLFSPINWRHCSSLAVSSCVGKSASDCRCLRAWLPRLHSNNCELSDSQKALCAVENSGRCRQKCDKEMEL
ncbi:uncharacterized protein LOC116800916 [Drosophila sechellia]|uniref:uncharacterized protein LOC116800916 n=1 Tax=Drosophila sechellia TaxID=7238 RepID=UPI0013DE16C8|nr:uncharacterized protein LOC116800916 [Drosophila sechellia]